MVISLQFKTDIARDSRAISVLNCSDIARDWCPLYQIVKDTSKIDNGYQLFQPAFGYNNQYEDGRKTSDFPPPEVVDMIFDF